MYGCKYISFSRSTSDLELIARRIIQKEEGGDVSRAVLDDYANPDSSRYACMVETIRQLQNYTTLGYNRLDDLIDAIGLPADILCTYCWTGRE